MATPARGASGTVRVTRRVFVRQDHRGSVDEATGRAVWRLPSSVGTLEGGQHRHGRGRLGKKGMPGEEGGQGRLDRLEQYFELT